jgi:2-(1,2-epoxy-1,2-dihydrophenyl)acetyl-CoA isomerase
MWGHRKIRDGTAMDYQTIRVTEQDGYAIVSLDRPDVMNALNTQMRTELLQALQEAGKRARAVVLTGAGRAFCSGQDLGDRAAVADIDMERTLTDEYVPMLRAIFDCPVPTIAAVNGPAAGAGANLALAADVVIATEEFDAHWRARAAKLASGPTVAYAMAKEALRASSGNTLEEQLLLEAQLQGRCGKTRDFREGVTAFMEKRPAEYEGR